MKQENFEDFIKSSLESMEESYDPQQWERLSSRLDAAPKSPASGNTAFKYASVAAIILAIGALTFWMAYPSSSSDSSNLTDNSVVNAPVVQNTTQETETEITSPEVPAEVAEPELKEEKPSAITDSQSAEKKVAETGSRNEIPKPENSLPEPRIEKPAPVKPAEAAPFLPGLKIYSPAVICEGESVRLTVNNEYASQAEFNWIINGNSYSGPEAEITATEKGSINVQLIASGNGRTKESTLTIPVEEKPSSEFSFSQDVQNLTGLLVEFNTEVPPGTSVAWDFGDGTTGTGPEPSHIFKSNRFYPVTATYRNMAGCTESITRQIEVIKTYPLGEQSTISPNFDGNNETFMPPKLAELNIPFEMTIVDATGKEIFRTTEVNKPWNGRLANSGEIMPIGFYKWNVLLNLPDGKTGYVDGVVRLIK